MSTDEQFGHRLGAQLRHETEDVHAAPDLVRTLRRRQSRRTWTIRAATATSVTVAAAAAIMVTAAGQGRPGDGTQTNRALPPTSSSAPQSTNSTTVRVQNLAQVQARTLEALGQASQYVIYSKLTYEGGHEDMWIDKATQRERTDFYGAIVGRVPKDGKPTATESRPDPNHLSHSASFSGPPGDQTEVWVYYDLQEWGTTHMTDNRPGEPDITDADSIRRAMAKGTVELLGNATVDGFDTIHLRLWGPDRLSRIDMWVDSNTYLPVQQTTAKRGDPNGPAFPPSATATWKYSWLPRTEENLAHLVLTPPPDFKQMK